MNFEHDYNNAKFHVEIMMAEVAEMVTGFEPSHNPTMGVNYRDVKLMNDLGSKLDEIHALLEDAQ